MFDVVGSQGSAVSVRRVTLREAVEDHAKKAGPRGFTDGDLLGLRPGTAADSFRKRRTELAQENIVLNTGMVRTSEHGQDQIVWVHRDWNPAPPPIIARTALSRKSKMAMLEAEVTRLKALLAAHGIPA